MTVGIVMLALYVWGVWLSWKGIENGTGWIGFFLKKKILDSLNRKENLWKKILLSLVFGYIAMGAKVIEWIFKLVLHMVDGSFFR